MTIDITRLPAPSIIEPLDYETILAERKVYFVSLHPKEQQADVAATLELESEPVVKLLQENAYRELILRQQHNERARKLLLAYASGPELDHIGVTYYFTERLLLRAADDAAIPPVPPVWELDRDYLRRLLLAHDAWSTAGSRQSYIYHTLSCSPEVADAAAVRPLPGLVRVYVLSRTAPGTASPELLAAATAALSAETVRPLNDTVDVVSATPAHYSVKAQLTIAAGPDSDVVISEATRRAGDYINEQHRLGGSIVLDKLRAMLYAPGVDYVHLQQPAADIITDESGAPWCAGISVTRSQP